MKAFNGNGMPAIYRILKDFISFYIKIKFLIKNKELEKFLTLNSQVISPCALEFKILEGIPPECIESKKRKGISFGNSKNLLNHSFFVNTPI